MSPARPPAHLTFGHGVRHRVGAPLAKIEPDIRFTRLVRRIPSLRPAIGVDEVRRRQGLGPTVAALPVAW